MRKQCCTKPKISNMLQKMMIGRKIITQYNVLSFMLITESFTG